LETTSDYPGLAISLSVFMEDRVEDCSLISEEASKFCNDEGLKIGCRDAPSG
jgi:hypothetical protein